MSEKTCQRELDVMRRTWVKGRNNARRSGEVFCFLPFRKSIYRSFVLWDCRQGGSEKRPVWRSAAKASKALKHQMSATFFWCLVKVARKLAQHFRRTPKQWENFGRIRKKWKKTTQKGRNKKARPQKEAAKTTEERIERSNKNGRGIRPPKEM